MLDQSSTPWEASTRPAGSMRVSSADRATAMRSRTWSRTPDSSGLKVATRTGLQGNLMETPSRSTRTQPSEMELRRRLHNSSSSRLISSMYRTPRWALANNPGWKTVFPCFTDSSTSTDPNRRSSMMFNGTCTKGASTISRSRSSSFWPVSRSILRVKSSTSSGLLGSMLNGLPLTRSMGGMMRCNPFAMTDLPVPRPPLMITPPMFGLMVANSKAVLISSQPRTKLRGNGLPRKSLGRGLNDSTGFLDPASSISMAALARAAASSVSLLTTAMEISIGPSYDTELAFLDWLKNHSPAEEINIPIANNMKLEVLLAFGLDTMAWFAIGSMCSITSRTLLPMVERNMWCSLTEAGCGAREPMYPGVLTSCGT
mmetsp:Transcript_33334/g.59690  ORF Transcript_33334/g.59690 Transcript_33334/m.59690 type:complete len:371 (+) Transcript_33334:1527-2639(+)